MVNSLHFIVFGIYKEKYVVAYLYLFYGRLFEKWRICIVKKHEHKSMKHTLENTLTYCTFPINLS